MTRQSRIHLDGKPWQVSVILVGWLLITWLVGRVVTQPDVIQPSGYPAGCAEATTGQPGMTRTTTNP